jgi:uncharacterized protein
MSDEQATDSKLPSAEEERTLFAERERCLQDHIRDLEKAYEIAMDLVKVASKEILAKVGANRRPLAIQDDFPNTRDLVAAILQRASSE